MVEETTDIDILSGLIKGDQGSFDLAFSRYYKYLYVIAFKYVADSHRAKDIVQDIFLDLWKRRQSLSITYSLKFFLRKAVINRCLAEKRKEDRLVYSEQNPETKMSSKEESETPSVMDMEAVLAKCLESMSEKSKRVFQLSRYEGYTHKEIAEYLGVSTKTIEHHITQALKQIRSAYKAHGFISIAGIILWNVLGIYLN